MLIQREICMFNVLLFQITDLFLFKCKNAPKQAKKKTKKQMDDPQAKTQNEMRHSRNFE